MDGRFYYQEFRMLSFNLTLPMLNRTIHLVIAWSGFPVVAAHLFRLCTLREEMIRLRTRSNGRFVPGSTQWCTEMIDLSAFNRDSHVSIFFVNVEGYDPIFIDNILVGGVAGETYQILSSMLNFNTLQEAISNANFGRHDSTD